MLLLHMWLKNYLGGTDGDWGKAPEFQLATNDFV